MRLDYGLYVAEAEGYLPPKEKRIEKVLQDIESKRCMGWQRLSIDNEYLAQFQLTMEDLTDKDFIRMTMQADGCRF